MKNIHRSFQRALALVLAFAMVLTMSTFTQTMEVSAASAKYVKSIKTSKKSVTVNVKKSVKVNATVKVAGKTSQKVTVKTSDKKVATVKAGKPNKKGVSTITITGKKAGKATITVTTSAKGKKGKKLYKKIKVTVKEAEEQPQPTPQPDPQPQPQPTPIQAPAMTDGSVQLPITNGQSSDPSIATVDATGKVTAGTKAGTVTITGKDAAGKDVVYTVTVTDADVKAAAEQKKPSQPEAVAVESVAFDKASYGVEKGKSVQANVTILPANATNKTVTFSSGDEKIATVTDAGIIFGFAAGSTTITATASNGKSATATVVVTEPIVIELSNTELTIGKNQTANITASIAGVTWSSDNTAVATVDENGKVTGISAGVANIVATSGTVSASCKVTVTQYDPENDGVTLSVFNPIKNNDDTIIDNTVLVNQDMIIQAYVQKDATPKKGSRVKLVLSEIDSYIVDKNDYQIKVAGVVTDTAVTNDEGIAEFTVSAKYDIPSTYDAKTDCPYISFNASTLVDNQPNDEDITVKFASVLRQGIQVDNNRYEDLDDIIPFDGHNPGDTGIQSSYNTNDYYPVEYVTSQQVGNNVYLSATPYFILPPDRSATAAKFEVVFPSKEVTSGQDDVAVVGPGATQSYTIYNDGTDMTTTTSIINVPEGLVSMSVFFNKISISKYSQLYVDLYEYDGAKGKLIYSKTYTEFEKEYTQEDGVQIKNLTDMKGKGILIVSIQSPGQVDISTTGYSLNRVTGDFNENTKAVAEEVEVVNAVKWTNVTTDARYEVAEKMDYAEVIKYLPEYKDVENSFVTDDANYTFEYRVPAFNSKAETANAITGNALITATYKDASGNVKTATYAYPAVRDTDEYGNTTNTNTLMPKTSKIKAIFLGYDVIDENGNIQQVTGGMTQNGNQAVIKSAATNVSGAIFVEARLQINALAKEIATCDKNKNYDKSPIKGANEKYPMYSYVQFVAKPEAKEADGVVPTFHAIEDQYIVVAGQVIADNGEVQPDQKVEFYVGNKKITSVETTIGSNVQVKYFDTKTNNDGKAYLVLVGHEGSFVNTLSVKYTGDFKTFKTYAGDQEFEAIKQGDEKKNICNLCWLDLGLAYEEDATKADTWIYSYESGATKNTKSESVVDKTWKVGFLPAVTCPSGSFNTDFAQLQLSKRDVTETPKNLFVDITNVDVNYRFDGTNYENCTTDPQDGAALITSSKTGDTNVYGELGLAGDTCHVTYYDAEGELQGFDTVGVSEYEVNASTFPKNLDFGGKILYKMTWQAGNWESEFTYPYGNRVYKEQDTKVYFRVHDKNGNPIVGKDVTVSAIFDGTNYTKFTLNAAKTDNDGLIVINVPRTSKTGDLAFTVEVAGGILKSVSTPIRYVDRAPEVEELKIQGEPVFDKTNTKQMKLTYNNPIVDTVLTPDMLQKLFVVKDKDGKVLEMAEVKVNLQTVTITLSKDTFIENEKYSVEVMTGEECKIDGIVYVMYDQNGQAMLTTNAKKEFTVKY